VAGRNVDVDNSDRWIAKEIVLERVAFQRHALYDARGR
jgi:hypothetical protein